MPETGEFHGLFESLTPAQQAATLGPLLELAGQETPGSAGNEARLKKWWLTQSGIHWGTGGDFDQCVVLATKVFGEHGVDIDPKAWCAALHKEATGARPGHAPGEAHESAEEAPVPHNIVETTGTLSEAVTDGSARSGRMTIQVITPGQGSSGYYSAAVCEAAAPLVAAGTKMYLDHPTEADEFQRPERSLRDLAAVFTGSGRWDATRNAVVAEAKVFAPYREVLTEMAPYIGVSVRGDGKFAESTAVDGQRRKVVESIESIASVDFVTAAGRGGRVLELLESARTQDPDPQPVAVEFTEAEAEQVTAYVQQMREATTSATTNVPVSPAGPNPQEQNMPNIEESEIAQLREAAGRVPALEERATTAERERDEARAQLAESTARTTATGRARTRVVEANGVLPAATVDRIVEAATRTVPLTEAGVLDETAFDTQVDAARTAEETYLTGLAEASGAGRIAGLGSLPGAGQDDESKVREANDKQRAAMFGRKIKEA